VTITYDQGADVCPPTRPDAAVRAHDAGPLVGDNVYGGARRQTVTRNAARGQTAVFAIKVQNDSDVPDRFRLVGTGSIAAMKATYLRGVSGTSNITVPVVNGTFVTPELGLGAATTIRLQVKVQSSASIGSVKPFHVTAISMADGTTADTVRARMKVVP
jgi:hypothetical protein